ncbi:rod shape-determining protein MreC [Candidatus Kaiserbacteria bacterium]|nr:rod shape-determining protein MreC [Candidatus Kaiserbacteria bacterium]
MNLYRRTNTTARRRLWAATFLVVAIFLLDLATQGLIRSATQSAAASLSGTGIKTFEAIKESGIFRTRASLAAENEDLKARLATYESQALSFKALKEENKQLAEMARLAHADSGLTVSVVSAFRSSPYGTFLIGAGADDGITIGSLVLTDDGFVIGHVTDVSTRTALVSEILGPSKKIDAIVAGSATVFTGSGGGNARAQVPRDIEVSVGDRITSQDTHARTIGVVGKIESSPADAYSTVYMRLPQNIATLRHVFVATTAP